MSTRESRINKEWIKKLKTGREDLILENLKEFRQTGSNQLLPEVIALLKNNSVKKIHDEVLSILSDLNNQSSVEIFMENIEDHRGTDHFTELVCACWQNGLDYSTYTDFFIAIVIDDPYETAIEAFTVVEGNVNSLPDKAREKMASDIEKAKSSAPIEKRGLLEELKSVVKPVSGGFRYDPE